MLSAGQKGTSQTLYARKQGEAKAFELLSMYGAWKWRHEDYGILKNFYGFTVETRAGILKSTFFKSSYADFQMGFYRLNGEVYMGPLVFYLLGPCQFGFSASFAL